MGNFRSSNKIDSMHLEHNEKIKNEMDTYFAFVGREFKEGDKVIVKIAKNFSEFKETEDIIYLTRFLVDMRRLSFYKDIMRKYGKIMNSKYFSYVELINSQYSINWWYYVRKTDKKTGFGLFYVAPEYAKQFEDDIEAEIKKIDLDVQNRFNKYVQGKKKDNILMFKEIYGESKEDAELIAKSFNESSDEREANSEGECVYTLCDNHTYMDCGYVDYHTNLVKKLQHKIY